MPRCSAGIREVELVRFADLCRIVLPVLNEDEDEIEIENGRKFGQIGSGDKKVVNHNNHVIIEVPLFVNASIEACRHFMLEPSYSTYSIFYLALPLH